MRQVSGLAQHLFPSTPNLCSCLPHVLCSLLTHTRAQTRTHTHQTGSGRQSALQWWLEWWEKRSERSGQLFAPELQDKDVAGALLEGVRLPPLAHRLAELGVAPEAAQRYQELVDECCALLPMHRPVIGRVLERLHDLVALC